MTRTSSKNSESFNQEPLFMISRRAIRGFAASLAGALLISTSAPMALAQDAELRAIHAQALEGDAASQIAMAMAHLKGEGVPIDRKAGLAWIISAAASGDQRAQKLRARAFGKLEPKDVIAAEALAFRIVRSVYAPKDPDGSSPSLSPFDLVYLSGTGPIEQVRSYVESGANVDASTPDGTTALAASLTARRFDIAQLLLRSGADTESKAPSGVSLLADAVAREDIVAIALLATHGASVFVPDQNGTPLFQSNVPEEARKYLAIEKRDMTRDEVREMQARLTAAGYKPGTIDGLIGRKTWSAFAAFSADHGFQFKERNPFAALQAVRKLIPTSEFRDEIAKAARTARAPQRQVVNRARAPQRTAAEIFFGESFTSGSAF